MPQLVAIADPRSRIAGLTPKYNIVLILAASPGTFTGCTCCNFCPGAKFQFRPVQQALFEDLLCARKEQETRKSFWGTGEGFDEESRRKSFMPKRAVGRNHRLRKVKDSLGRSPWPC